MRQRRRAGFALAVVLGAAAGIAGPGPRTLGLPGAWPLPTCAAGDEEPLTGARLEAAIVGWIQDLSAPAYVRREAARHHLAQHVEAARERLEALRESGDAEVRRTVELLLATQAGATTGEEVLPVTAGLNAASLGAFEDDPARATPVARLEHLLTSVGGHAVWPGEPPADVAAPPPGGGAAGVGRSFFALVDQLAAAGGAVASDAFDSLGALHLVAAEGAPPPAPLADAGLFRVRVVEVTRTRTLGSADGAARTTLGLHVAWAPALEVRELRAPRVISARDDAGAAWSAATRGGFTMMGLSSGSSSARIPLVLESSPDAASDELTVLEIEIPMLARHGRRQLLVDGEGALPRHLDADGRSTDEHAAVLSLLSLVSEPPGSGSWSVEAVARLPEGRSATAGLVLVTDDGRLLRMHVSAGRVVSADGTVHLTGRAWRAGAGPPRAFGLAWFEHEDAVTLRVRLEHVPLR